MRELIVTRRGPRPIGPYSQAIRAHGLIFVSGQIPIDPATHRLAPGGITEQTNRAIENVARVLEAAGSGLERVVRCVVYLRAMDDFVAMNEAYARYFGDRPPARTAVAVAGLPQDSLVEIEATALE